MSFVTSNLRTPAPSDRCFQRARLGLPDLPETMASRTAVTTVRTCRPSCWRPRRVGAELQATRMGATGGRHDVGTRA